MTTSTHVKVLLFSVLRQKIGKDRMMVELAPPATGSSLLDHLGAQFPEIDAYRSVLRLAVNQEYVFESVVLQSGDEVALITPVSGG